MTSIGMGDFGQIAQPYSATLAAKEKPATSVLISKIVLVLNAHELKNKNSNNYLKKTDCNYHKSATKPPFDKNCRLLNLKIQ